MSGGRVGAGLPSYVANRSDQAMVGLTWACSAPYMLFTTSSGEFLLVKRFDWQQARGILNAMAVDGTDNTGAKALTALLASLVGPAVSSVSKARSVGTTAAIQAMISAAQSQGLITQAQATTLSANA